MSDKKEDKACPFCGSDEWYFADHQEGCYLYKMHMADEEDADYGKDEMMESWNTRPAIAGDKDLAIYKELHAGLSAAYESRGNELTRSHMECMELRRELSKHKEQS